MLFKHILNLLTSFKLDIGVCEVLGVHIMFEEQTNNQVPDDVTSNPATCVA